MKKTDEILIAQLRQNGRFSLTELSKRTGMPISTVHDRMKTQVAILRHTALLDFTTLGYPTRVQIFFRVKKEEKESIQDYLAHHFNVNTLAKINSGYDFLVEAVFRDIKGLEDFLGELEKAFTIKGKQVIYIIEEIAKEKFMTCGIEDDT